MWIGFSTIDEFVVRNAGRKFPLKRKPLLSLTSIPDFPIEKQAIDESTGTNPNLLSPTQIFTSSTRVRPRHE
jgi:hypothetical protein